ncbi:MAG TPA: T9SS type A sorting domain-containing protein [Flavobacteriales bacterium]|nr:T9SS type A sorting domain-containing protein [Flavobacteriales bacterium]
MKKIVTLTSLLLLLFNQQTWSQPVFEWVKNIGGSGTDVGTEITSDADGNVIVCGRFENTIDSDPGSGTNNLVSAGSFDMVVIKFDANGQFLWSKQIGGTGYDEFTNVECDAAGNVILIGYFEGVVDIDPNAGVNTLTSQGTSDLFVLKLSPLGETIWMHEISGTSSESTGGLSVISTGHIFVSGGFTGTAIFSSTDNLTSAGENDAYVLKLNPDGTLNWVKQIGGTSFDYSYDIDTYSNGEVVLTGRFRDVVDFNPGAATASSTSNGLNDGFIVKLSTNGDYIWHQTFGGTGFDEIWAIATDLNNNTFTFGFFSGTVDLDPGATVQNFTSNGADDLFIQKYSSSGSLLWVKTFGGSELENSYDISTDSEGNVVVIGDYFNTVDFDPGVGVFNLTSQGNNDIFMMQLDANGDFDWAQSIGSNFSQAGYALYINSENDILSTGTFSNLVDFNPGSGNTNTNANLFNIFILKFANSCVLPVITSVIASEQVICEGASVLISINGVLNDGALWAIHAGDCNGSPVATTTSSEVSFIPVGEETYFVRGQGGCVTSGLTACSEINLITHSSYLINENATVCSGDSYTFPDGSSQIITETISYESELQSIEGCDSLIITSIDVENLPNEFEITDSSIVILDYNSKSGVSIEWIDCNTNEPIANENGPVFLFNNFQSVAVVISNGNCTDTSDCFTVTGISSTALNNVEVYPNPFLNTINLKHVKYGALVELFSIDGRLVYQSVFKGDAVEIPNPIELSSGLYTVKISTSDGATFRKVLKM